MSLNIPTKTELLDRGFDPKDLSGEAIFLSVAKEGSLELLQLLLDRNESNINEIKDENERDLLYYAAGSNSEEKVRLLLDRGMRPAAQPTDKQTISPLFPAIESGNATVVKLLLDHGANPEIRAVENIDEDEEDQIKTTPLIVAVKEGHDELFEMLFANGLDPHYEINETSTALCHAADTCNLPIITRLLDLGFNIESSSTSFWYYDATLLSIATHRCAETNPPSSEAVLKLLLERGADPNSPTGPHGMPPISQVAAVGREGAVRILLDHGADPRIMDEDGLIALWRAAEQNQAGVMRIFLDYAVEQKWKGDYTNAAISGAEYHEAHDVLKLLREHRERYNLQCSNECCE